MEFHILVQRRGKRERQIKGYVAEQKVSDWQMNACVGASMLQLGLIESEMHAAAESASAGADVDLDEDDDEAIENILQTATTTGISYDTIVGDFSWVAWSSHQSLVVEA